MSARDDQKVRYQAYRAVACRFVATHRANRAGVLGAVDVIAVPEHAAVQEVEDGAFVEATIWVPRSALPTKEDQ